MEFYDPFYSFATSGDLTHVYQDLVLVYPDFDPLIDPFFDTADALIETVWEQPMPLKPDPPTQVVPHASSSTTVAQPEASFTDHTCPTQVVSHASNHESVELDSALALSPEPTPLPTVQQYSYFFPQNHPHLSVYHQPICYGQQQSPFKAKRHRVVEDDDDIFEPEYGTVPAYGTVRAYPTAQEYSTVPDYEAETEDFGEEDDPTGGFKLPASKSPIMEAMVVCAMNGWGIEIITNNRATSTTPAEVVFRVTDFNHYYKISRIICSKQRPTDDLGSRIKSLRRWFVNFPKKKDRCENSFNLIVKPMIAKKVSEIIERNQKTFGFTKRSRRH